MGVVYKITFPDGTFYIGCTINLESRILQHRYIMKDSLLGRKIKQFKMSRKEFIELFSVLYDGEDYKYTEEQEIEKVKEDRLCLNMVGVRYFYKSFIGRSLRKTRPTISPLSTGPQTLESELADLLSPITK